MKKEKIKIEIIEDIVLRINKNKQFCGKIIRRRNNDDKMICIGKIKINDGYIFAMGQNQDELWFKLNELAKIVMEKNVHSNRETMIKSTETKLCLN